MRKARRIWIYLAALVMAMALVPVGKTDTLVGWGYRRSVIIYSSQVASDLTDFPVLLSLSGDWLRDTANGGHVGQPDGGDILFLAADYSQLDHEIEAYDATNGTLDAWVRIPLLSGSTDTQIWVYYGNPSCPDQWNPQGVWDANYTMVHHLHEASGLHEDSTVYGNDGTPLGGVNQNATGQIDGADDFDGNLTRVDCGTGGEGWRDQRWGQQRAVIKNGKIYVVGGGIYPPPFSAYIFVFDLATGALLQQSPSLGPNLSFTASETAPVVDGDMVYACPTFGDVWAWNMQNNSVQQLTDGLSIWSNRLEYDGTSIYATTTDYKVVRVNVTDPTDIDIYTLPDPDDGGADAVPPYLDAANGVVFAMGATMLHKLSADHLTPLWTSPPVIGSDCLDDGMSSHSRMAPIVVNDSHTGGEPWVIFGCYGTDIFYAYDYSGNQKWNRSIPEGVRALASYSPNYGYLYIPSQGSKIYALNVEDGSVQFSIVPGVPGLPAGSEFHQPCTVVHNGDDNVDYLIFKTTNGDPRYIYVFDAYTGGYLTRYALRSDEPYDPFLTCFPIGASGGYLVTGGSIVNYTSSQSGGIWAVKAGNGQSVDYYPLYGPYRYGYIENGLTDLAGENSLNPTDQITLEAWANVRELSSGSNDHLVCRELTYCLKFAQGYVGGDQPRFQLYGTDGSWHNLDLSGPLSINEWYHLAGTWDGSDMRIYINGQPQGPTPTFGGPINSTSVSTFIGSYNGGNNQAPRGVIDEVRISRIARSAEWIETGYSNQSSPEGFYGLGAEEPTAIRLISFTATPGSGTVILAWETATEIDNLGFHLYRAEAPGGEYTQLNDALIPSLAPGSAIGAVYTWRDEDVLSGVTYYYELEDVDLSGNRTRHGPVWATAEARPLYSIYLPLVVRNAGGQ